MEQLEQHISFDLGYDEYVLWSGRPKYESMAESNGGSAAGGSIMIVMVALLFLVVSIISNAGPTFVIFSSFMTLAGVAVVIATFNKPKGTFYFITNKRIIYCKGGRRKLVVAQDIVDTPTVDEKPGVKGTKSLFFDTALSKVCFEYDEYNGQKNYLKPYKTLIFLNIENAMEVIDIVRSQKEKLKR